MKKIHVLLFALIFCAGVVLAFFAGSERKSAEYEDRREILFDKYIALAIDAAESKGLFVEGNPEWIASNLWVAHELCTDPETSSLINDLWYTLIYQTEDCANLNDTVLSKLKQIQMR